MGHKEGGLRMVLLFYGWGHAFGQTGLGNFRCTFHLFSGEEASLGLRVWGRGNEPGPAGSLLESHRPKKSSHGHCLTRIKEQHSPKKQELTNVVSIDFFAAYAFCSSSSLSV